MRYRRRGDDDDVRDVRSERGLDVTIGGATVRGLEAGAQRRLRIDSGEQRKRRMLAEGPTVRVDALRRARHEIVAHPDAAQADDDDTVRSEERRVGKECRSRW